MDLSPYLRAFIVFQFIFTIVTCSLLLPDEEAQGLPASQKGKLILKLKIHKQWKELVTMQSIVHRADTVGVCPTPLLPLFSHNST
jgi:hypothetical protein